MSRTTMKNFCVEPTSARCSCPRDIRCGGIVEAVGSCEEHGGNPLDPIMVTHFHFIQASPPTPRKGVGTRSRSSYDEAKAS